MDEWEGGVRVAHRGETRVWPVFRTSDESCSNGILVDVIRLLGEYGPRIDDLRVRSRLPDFVGIRFTSVCPVNSEDFEMV